MKRLEEIDLSNNLLQCDCTINLLLSHLNKASRNSLCAGPPNFAGKNLVESVNLLSCRTTKAKRKENLESHQKEKPEISFQEKQEKIQKILSSTKTTTTTKTTTINPSTTSTTLFLTKVNPKDLLPKIISSLNSIYAVSGGSVIIKCEANNEELLLWTS